MSLKKIKDIVNENSPIDYDKISKINIYQRTQKGEDVLVEFWKNNGKSWTLQDNISKLKKNFKSLNSNIKHYIEVSHPNRVVKRDGSTISIIKLDTIQA